MECILLFDDDTHLTCRNAFILGRCEAMNAGIHAARFVILARQ